jgi:hypothetical protein
VAAEDRAGDYGDSRENLKRYCLHAGFSEQSGGFTLEDRMKKFALIASLAVLVVLALGIQFSFAQDDSADRGASSSPPATQPSSGAGGKIDASDPDAVQHAIGSRVTLEGTIEKAAWSSSGKVLKATFKGNDKLTLVAFQSKKDDLDKAFNGDVAGAMTGSKVQVSGLLKQFKGSPEMVIDDAKQLTISSTGSTTKASQ